ncbi:5620_t:CDS:2 [Paraglomus occultum]|uniref:5620_t:CDS:1 n=1 Tax=Paraglomus occultum TaxID=144539 RepID=A0A9N9F9B1_9GLOM|nr:5620_t:CDS:2 [Paraglomus occultum]
MTNVWWEAERIAQGQQRLQACLTWEAIKKIERKFVEKEKQGQRLYAHLQRNCAKRTAELEYMCGHKRQQMVDAYTQLDKGLETFPPAFEILNIVNERSWPMTTPGIANKDKASSLSSCLNIQ